MIRAILPVLAVGFAYLGLFQQASAAPAVHGSAWLEQQGDYALDVFQDPLQVSTAYVSLMPNSQGGSSGSSEAASTCGWLTCLFSCDITCCPYSLCQPPAVTVCPQSIEPCRYPNSIEPTG